MQTHNGETILVIDDDKVNLQILSQTLKHANYQVITADDAPDALTRLERVQPDLILLDIMMPKMNGFEFFEQLRAHQNPVTASIPVIFISGLTDTKTIVRGLKLKAADFIGKPFRTEEVLARVEKQLALQRLQNDLKTKNDRLEREIAGRGRVESELRRSQRDLARAHKMANLGIFRHNLITDELVYSRELCRIIGWGDREQTVTVEQVKSIIHPDDWPALVQAKRNVVQNGGDAALDIRVILPDGRLGYAHNHFEAVTDEHGQVVQIFGTIQDISDRKQAEGQIRQQNIFLHNIIESLSSPFYVINADDCFVEIANSAARALGIKEQTTCYARIYHQDTPCEGLECCCALAPLKQSKKPVVTEHLYCRANGEVRVLETHGYPLFDETGQVKQVIEYSIDITERKLVEEEVRKLSQAVEQSGSNIVITDLNATIEFVNPAFTKTTGYTPAEAIGQNPRILKSGKTPPRTYQEMWDALTRGEVWQGELLNKKKDGELFWEFATISPIKDNNGEITHYVAVKEDITKRKEMEEAMIMAKEAAERGSQAKSAFLANMSHELRTPLNGVLGYIQVLKDFTPLNARQQKYVATIEKSGQHLLTLIDDALDIAKIEAGKISLQPDSLYLPTFLNSIADIFRIRAEQKNIDFVAQFSKSIPAVIRADEKRLRQILINLLGNAVKFTREGQVILRVQTMGGVLKWGERPDNLIADSQCLLRFEVIDTGPGIPLEEQDNIFHPFHQVLAHPQKQEGTGLGLAISRQLAELMDCTILVESPLPPEIQKYAATITSAQPELADRPLHSLASTQGPGSVFWFEAQFPVEVDKSAIIGEPARKIVGFQGDRHTVLVVDAIATNREVLKDTLIVLGFNVIEAEDGESGLEMARQHQPQLLLVDLHMPRLNGYDMVRQLRKSDQLATIPVIGISTSTFDDDRQAFLAAGGDEFLPKPVEVERLFSLLEKYLPGVWLRQKQASSRLKIGPLVEPPPEALDNLRELVQMGDVRGIKEELNRLELLGEEFQPFFTTVRRLMEQFKFAAIKKLIDDDSTVG